MKHAKRLFCFWCGDDIGQNDGWSDGYEACGNRECEREARYAQQAERSDRQERAAEDDYSLY